MSQLIVRRGNFSCRGGQGRDDDYDVLENGVKVGRIFKVPVAPQDRPLDVGQRPRRPPHRARGAWLRADA